MRKCLEIKLNGGLLSLYLIVYHHLSDFLRAHWSRAMVGKRIDHKTDVSRILKGDDTIPVDS